MPANATKRDMAAAQPATVPVIRLRICGMIALCGAAVIGIRAASFFVAAPNEALARESEPAVTAELSVAAMSDDGTIRVSAISPNAGDFGLTPPAETAVEVGSLPAQFGPATGFRGASLRLELEPARKALADVGVWLAHRDSTWRTRSNAWICVVAGSLRDPQPREVATNASHSNDAHNVQGSSLSRPAASQAPPKAMVSFEIRNPDGNGGEVRFLVGRELLSLAPGETKAFLVADDAAIRFDRGADFGPATLPPSEGRFEFFVGERGWDLKHSE